MAELFEGYLEPRKPRDLSRFKPGQMSVADSRVADVYRNSQKEFSEAVVKVTSYTHNSSEAHAHASYVNRKGLEGIVTEVSDGSLLTHPDDVKDLVDEWFTRKVVRVNERRTVNMILSSPYGTDPSKVRIAVREFAKEEFKGHDWMFVVHTDTPYHHAHLTVKMRGHDGKQMDIRKARLQKMREHYAIYLRAQGVNVRASYRSDRGLWDERKPVNGSPYHSQIVPSKNKDAVNHQRYVNTVAKNMGAAQYLRKQHGDKFEIQAKELEAFARQLPRPSQAENLKKTEHFKSILDPEKEADI